MSKRINIPSSIEDPAYRYTMPVMTLKQESRLNGVKTNITNLADVAFALRVPDSAIIKYFCAEVGANQEQTSIVKGDHKYGTLLTLLDKFIIKYVCCGKCKYPECAFETQKKDLIAICNACGHSKKLDTLHKAGKQLFKEVPTFYANNPEFKGKTNKNVAVLDELAAVKTKKKKSKKSGKKEAEEAKVEAENQALKKKERAQKTLETGGEVNVLDAVALALDAPEIQQLVNNVNTSVTESISTNEELIDEVRHMQVGLNITPDYKFYILFMGVFSPERNIVTNWPKFEDIFMKLVEETGEPKGLKRLWQTIVIYFVHKYPDQQKYLDTFLKILYDASVFTDEFIISWHEAKTKMDKSCCLYDRKAEKQMRGLTEAFVAWLQSAEYGSEGGYGEEDETEEVKEEEDAPKNGESDAARRQRELVEAQMKAQADTLAANKLKNELEAEIKAKEEAEEESKNQVEEVKETTDIHKIAVEDDFDIDDI